MYGIYLHSINDMIWLTFNFEHVTERTFGNNSKYLMHWTKKYMHNIINCKSNVKDLVR